MLRTYRGRYERGRIILPDHEQVLLPDAADVIITVLNEDGISLIKSGESSDTLSDKQKAVALAFLRAVQGIRNNGFDADDDTAISDLRSGKYKPTFGVRLQ